MIIMEKSWSHLKEEIAKALDVDIKDVEEPEKYGDFAYACFPLAKKLKKDPKEIAVELSKKLKIKLIEKIEATGPYINFYIDWKEFGQKILESINEDYGKPAKVKKKKIMVEHTSANPNKALHIGHTRNSCLGDCLFRILSFFGHDVEVANYIDDTGAQIADIIVGLKFLNIPMETEKKFDHYCGDSIYVKVNEMYKSDPELAEKRKLVIPHCKNRLLRTQ